MPRVTSTGHSGPFRAVLVLDLLCAPAPLRLQVCQLEVQLFEQFFPLIAPQQPAAGAAAAPQGGPSPEALAPLLEPLAMLLYDVLRPAVIGMQDIDELCELVDILKHEVGGCRQAPGGTRGMGPSHLQLVGLSGRTGAAERPLCVRTACAGDDPVQPTHVAPCCFPPAVAVPAAVLAA